MCLLIGKVSTSVGVHNTLHINTLTLSCEVLIENWLCTGTYMLQLKFQKLLYLHFLALSKGFLLTFQNMWQFSLTLYEHLNLAEHSTMCDSQAHL